MTEPDRGESYLEIQMDRSTIVLAALGVVACMVVAFLLGSWTASRKASADQAAARIDADRSPDGSATEGTATEQDVDAEPSFGGRPVSASGAPPLTAVPMPAPVVSSTRHSSTSRPKGSTGITVASDGDDVKVEDVPAAGTASTRSPAPTPSTKAPVKAPAKTATKTPAKTSSSSSSSDARWVVQVAAVQARSEAETLQRRLEGKGYPVRLLEESGFVKVQVGPYAQKSEALEAEQRLKHERGLATWVKKA